MAIAAECFVPQLGCEALFPVSGARVPHHHPSPHLPTTSVSPSSTLNNKEFAVPKDYSIPLHVDCSVEYDLPDCAKPPQGVKIEPLLMIHPTHFRRLESMRRCPFVNNLPAGNNSKVNFDVNTSLTSSGTVVMNNNSSISNITSACQYPQVRATRSSTRNQQSATKFKESPNILLNNVNTNKKWPNVANNNNINNKINQCKYGELSQSVINNNNNNLNNNLLLQPSHLMQYRVADVPDPYWSSACGGPSLPFAPKEGDTLENSTFCNKFPKYRSTSRLRSHPYSDTSSINCATPIISTANCDNSIIKNNLDILQGNPLVSSSPFHAKMFSTTGGDSNLYPTVYPLVMYK